VIPNCSCSTLLILATLVAGLVLNSFKNIVVLANG
jgi:hypothetical protein